MQTLAQTIVVRAMSRQQKDAIIVAMMEQLSDLIRPRRLLQDARMHACNMLATLDRLLPTVADTLACPHDDRDQT